MKIVQSANRVSALERARERERERQRQRDREPIRNNTP
jgi:hypothetical protein